MKQSATPLLVEEIRHLSQKRLSFGAYFAAEHYYNVAFCVRYRPAQFNQLSFMNAHLTRGQFVMRLIENCQNTRVFRSRIDMKKLCCALFQPDGRAVYYHKLCAAVS